MLARVREGDVHRAVKYSAVSAVAFPVTQVLLLIGTLGLGWSSAVSNVVAVSLAAVPAYLLNRYWVWAKTGKNSLTTEVLPFWGLTLLGLLLSTILAAYGDHNFDSPLVANVANTVGFGTIWVFKFFALDRWMFGQGHHHPSEPEPAGA